MKKKITEKVESYMSAFKNEIKDFIQKGSIQVLDSDGNDIRGNLLQFIYDYDNLEFVDEDFQKRKRVKNKVPDFNRCCALKCNGERCSRRVKVVGEDNYCGTHLKGIPYGSILNQGAEETPSDEKKIEIWIEEINGIQWYIDADLNVYDSTDIITGSKNPKVIHKLKRNSDYKYEFCN